MQLQSERLMVEYAEPGSLYTGLRFDWTGFVTQVTLDGRHTFCMPESLVPGKGSGGQGLCNEFGIFAAIGYDEIAPGECFPKIGVGLLTRPDEKPYSFFRSYEVVPFPMRVRQEGQTLIATVDPLPCNGYAVRLQKTFAVAENRLSISYTLENVGEKAISTEEYCHNFIGIDGHPVGPEYRLRLPQSIQLGELPGGLRVTDGVVRWSSMPEQAFHCPSIAAMQREGDSWEIRHDPSGVAVRATEQFPLSRFALWGTTHVVSAEAFVRIDLQPGEQQQWSRQYEFLAE